jgi:hypothetical protein
MLCRIFLRKSCKKKGKKRDRKKEFQLYTVLVKQSYCIPLLFLAFCYQRCLMFQKSIYSNKLHNYCHTDTNQCLCAIFALLNKELDAGIKYERT